MARNDENRQSAPVPEADWLEQEQQADPRVGRDRGWPTGVLEDVDEGDRLEQAQEVLGDPDEEYEGHPT